MTNDQRFPISDRGVATVWAATAVAVLLALGAFGIQLGSAITIRHRVEAAADLAALAAAAHRMEGESLACGYAARVAVGMATRLESCELETATVRVQITARGPTIVPVPLGSATGRARAGPAE
ncbi:MAG TPA: Rv3654c family TadE-like protein [Pseudonocardia sp.]|jgi:secretion/DNA translocation related TadE-like protein|nr:Rv3654c family TadE-like protein [Pseudonocardia sp.]